MGRRYAHVKRALPTRDCEAIEKRVETLTKNLLGTAEVIEFPGMGADLERIAYDAVDLPRVRDAYSYFQHVVTKIMDLNVRGLRTGELGWDIRVMANTSHPDISPAGAREKYGFIHVARDRVPRLGTEQMPEDLHAIFAAHVRYRYAVGVEIGICRKIVKDVLDRLSSPMQVRRVWPELLQYCTGENDKLDVKMSKLRERATTRIVMPQFWAGRAENKDGSVTTVGEKYMAAIRRATLTLAKCSILSDYDIKQGHYRTVVTRLGAGVPTAPWDGQPIPIV